MNLIKRKTSLMISESTLTINVACSNISLRSSFHFTWKWVIGCMVSSTIIDICKVPTRSIGIHDGLGWWRKWNQRSRSGCGSGKWKGQCDLDWSWKRQRDHNHEWEGLKRSLKRNDEARNLSPNENSYGPLRNRWNWGDALAKMTLIFRTKKLICQVLR